MPFSFAGAPLRSPNPFLRRRPQIAGGRKPEEEAELKMYSLARPNANVERPQAIPFRGSNTQAPNLARQAQVPAQMPSAADTVMQQINTNPPVGASAQQFRQPIGTSAPPPIGIAAALPSYPPAGTALQHLARPPVSAPLPQPVSAPAMASEPFQQQSPADRFRSINQNLPDGVQYEPLDPETLRLLKETAGSPTPPVPEMPRSPIPPAPQIPASVSSGGETAAELIERLMQDERNAKIFYSHLAESAPRPDIESAMMDLAEGCSSRLKDYGQICARLHRRPFTPKDTEINTGIEFEDGIALAISEENKSIRALTEWLDSRPDGDTARLLQNIINKKITNQNLLNLINSNLNFPFRF